MPPQAPPPGMPPTPPQPPQYPPPGGQAGGAQGPDVGAAFSYGWKKFQEHVGAIAIAIAAWVGAAVIGTVLYFIVVGVVSDIFTEETETVFGTVTTSSPGLFGSLIIVAVGALIFAAIYFIGNYGLVRGALAITAGRQLTTAELFDTKNLGPYIITSFLSAIIVSIGQALCVLPGIAAMFLLFFAPFYAAEHGMSPLDAMKKSVDMVMQNVGTVLLFILGAYVAMIVGFIACLIGVLVTLPVSLIAAAYIFRAVNNEPIAP